MAIPNVAVRVTQQMAYGFYEAYHKIYMRYIVWGQYLQLVS